MNQNFDILEFQLISETPSSSFIVGVMVWDPRIGVIGTLLPNDHNVLCVTLGKLTYQNISLNFQIKLIK